MRTLEFNSARTWVNALLNSWPLCLDTDSVRTLLSLAHDTEGIYQPGDTSLFYNGLKPLRNLRFQCGCGWKINGRIAITFRFQTDASAAAGVHGVNLGQAAGWARGTA